MTLKTLFAGAALALANPALAHPPAGDPDAARVVSVVRSIPLAVDLAAYDLAERAFAPEIVVDYTSLWGGAPARTTPAALMTAWRGIVPGFDGTWHELGPVAVRIDGDHATAAADVDGRHWLDGRLWRPIGRYDWTLVRAEG
nr:nuclear transport factor 2 family protein [Burkholderiales bacterium]